MNKSAPPGENVQNQESQEDQKSKSGNPFNQQLNLQNEAVNARISRFSQPQCVTPLQPIDTNLMRRASQFMPNQSTDAGFSYLNASNSDKSQNAIEQLRIIQQKQMEQRNMQQKITEQMQIQQKPQQLHQVQPQKNLEQRPTMQQNIQKLQQQQLQKISEQIQSRHSIPNSQQYAQHNAIQFHHEIVTKIPEENSQFLYQKPKEAPHAQHPTNLQQQTPEKLQTLSSTISVDSLNQVHPPFPNLTKGMEEKSMLISKSARVFNQNSLSRDSWQHDREQSLSNLKNSVEALGTVKGFYSFPNSRSNQDLTRMSRMLNLIGGDLALSSDSSLNFPFPTIHANHLSDERSSLYDEHGGMKQSNESQDQLSFELKSLIDPDKLPPLPDNSDQIWQLIQDKDETVSFTELLDHIFSTLNPKHLMNAILDNPSKTNQVTQELSRHLNYLHRIFNAGDLISFTSQMRLDPKHFRQSLNSTQSKLFDLSLHLLDKILRGIPNDSERKTVIHEFAQYLIPNELINIRKSRSSLQYLLFLPITSYEGTKHFIATNAKRSYIYIYTGDGSGNVIITFSFDKLTYDANGHHLIFETPNKTGVAPFTYKFKSSSEAHCWTTAVSSNESDPLLTFMTCVPYMLELSDSAPKDFFDQIAFLVASPDMDLARAICEVGRSNLLGSDNFNLTTAAVKAVLSILSNKNLAAQFVRLTFQDEIDATTNPNVIFRESSSATLVSTVLLTSTDDSWLDQVCRVLSKHSTENLNAGILAFVKLQKLITPMIKFVCSASFRATRRKYPYNLVPLSATSAILFLRYIIPAFPNFSPELTIYGQKFVKPFFFSSRSDPRFSVEKRTYMIIAKYLTILARVQDSSISLPDYNKENLIPFLRAHPEKIMVELSKILTKKDHPLKISILEIIENIMNGTDEVFETRILNKTLFISD